jgi:tetratricopeptide (TPR) repeat protein
MAFGFGFNKTKVLSAAERYVQQGKLLNAIAEYEKVVKADPKDLTVLNTIGDLYARIGQTEQAASYFRNVGDAYGEQGFTVKAIAMYKKLTKLNPSNECILKLAELYSQQGLFNDARAQYLHLAEQAMRSGQLEQAVQIFQKILEMDPENTAMQVKLAEVYVRLGKKEEGAKIFTKAAEALQARGAGDQAEEILKRMLALDPGNTYALVLRGKSALDGGDGEGAIEVLEKVPGIENNPDGLRYLMRAYLLANRRSDAAATAGKLFTLHKDSQGIAEYADAMFKAGAYDEALRTYYEYSEQLLAGDTSAVIESLRSAISHVKDNPAALEILRDLMQKAGDTANIAEITELLAHAYVQAGQLPTARDLYKQLMDLEPDNAVHGQNYRQIVSKLGGEPVPTPSFSAEDGALQLDELEATAPVVSEHYPDELATVVRAAITDAELFLSYNLPAKAMAPLLAVLPKAPKDIRVNQRLASLHARNSRFADAAQCCRTLATVFSDAGYPDEALRYAEIAEKYAARAKTLPTPAPLAVPAPVAPKSKAKAVAAAAPVAEPVKAQQTTAPAEKAFAAAAPWPVAPTSIPPHVPASVEMPVRPAEQEIDISGEWNAEAEAQVSPAKVEKPASTGDEQLDAILDEIRFYLSNSMWEEAWAAISNAEALSPGVPELEKLKKQFEASKPAKVIEPIAPPPPGPEPVAAAPESVPAPVAAIETHVVEEPVPQRQEAPAAHYEPQPSAAPAAPYEPQPVEAGGDGLNELVFELEQSLGDLEPQEAQPPAKTKAPAYAAASTAPVPVPQPAIHQPASQVTAPSVKPAATASVATAARPPASAGMAQAESALADIFSDFKQELEHETGPAEDPDTHYNLGVAFKEMGLLDEAISELQKVCQAVESGHAFSQAMQAYTWLAQCFLEKGVPEAAVRWYEKALKLPSIDSEARTALHYELASAYEAANNKDSALTHFLEVYGSNIDYRDVAERIKALKS